MIIQSAVSGICLGLAAHLLSQLFEPPLVSTVRLHVFGFFGLTGLLWKGQGLSLFHALAAVMTLSASYAVSLASSITIYRLFFHRLRSLPGEALHKLTMLTWVQVDWQSKRPSTLQSLHARYGTVIRIGPRELSIADYTASAAIYGGKCPKGPWYSSQSTSPITSSLQSETMPSTYSERHQRWQTALSTDALKEWNSNLIPAVRQLIDQLGAAAKEESPVDIGESLTKYCLDTSSLLAVGNSLCLLDATGMPPMVEPLEEGSRLLNTLGHIPYLLEAVRLIPSSTRDFDRWVSSSVQSQIGDEKGVRGHRSLVDHLRQGGEPKEHLAPDASLFILHGSDAIKSALAASIRELVKQPELCQRLQNEISATFGNQDLNDLSLLQRECPFLNACISEALRLWPPVPDGPQRVTPSQGLKVSDQLHIPGNTMVSVPTYTLHRDAANFSSPDVFDPTRWLPSESKATKHNVDAYKPFGHGSMGCLGQELALMQCRLVLGSLFQSVTIISGGGVANDDQKTLASTSHLVTLVPR